MIRIREMTEFLTEEYRVQIDLDFLFHASKHKLSWQMELP